MVRHGLAPLSFSHLARALCIAAVLLTFPSFARSCALAYRESHAGRSFRVRILSRGYPSEGLRIELERDLHGKTESTAPLYAVTGENGYASFRGVPPGDYFLNADHDEGFGDEVIVHVSARGVGEQTVSLQWPSEEPLRVRSISGSLHGPDFYAKANQAAISLKLLQGTSGKPIAETTTDSKGVFRFDEDIAPGLYFLDVDASRVLADLDGPMKGLIALDVRADAPLAQMNLDLNLTDCGMNYETQEPIETRDATTICGSVKDPKGEDIGGADVLLLSNDDATQVIAESMTDSLGNFRLPNEPDGTYKLLIRLRGFRSYFGSVQVHAAHDSEGCTSPIAIRLHL